MMRCVGWDGLCQQLWAAPLAAGSFLLQNLNVSCIARWLYLAHAGENDSQPVESKAVLLHL